jgi:hypothetical protein
MRVLRFICSGVLAFDRVGLFLVMPLAFFSGKVLDIHGAFGVTGTGLVQGSWAPMVRVSTGSDDDALISNAGGR